MSLTNLNLLTSRFPREKDLIYKVNDLIESRSGKYTEVSFEQFISWSQNSSTLVLAEIIQALIDQGVIKKIIRLEVGDSSVKDYDSMEQIPAVEHDIYNDVKIEVKPENLRVYFKLAT